MLKKSLKIFYPLLFFWISNSYADEFGKDILLIINYNTAHYGSIDFLKELYSPYFPNIVFTGPQHHPQVEYCEHRSGWFSHKVFAQIMQKYPNYTGYLYVHDDCILNPWNFTRFDKNKIWFKKSWFARFGTPDMNQWWFPNPEVGANAIKRAYDNFPQKYKDTLAQTCGQSNTILWAYSDIGYIPARFKDDVIILTEILVKSKTFLEIALPTMCGALDNMANWNYLNGIELWHGENPHPYYNKTIDYIHPMKLSNMGHREFLKHQFKKSN